MTYQQHIIEHYKRVWGSEPEVYLWDKGPIEKLPYDFRILEFKPSRERNMWTYATCCMSELKDANPVELHLFSSVKDIGLIELLTTVAYYHRNTSKINLNHTVNFGRPWQNGSMCTHGFVSLPYLDGPDLEDMRIENRTTIKFYWLIPITQKEAEFKTLNGVEALETKFEETEFDYVNPGRRSTV